VKIAKIAALLMVFSSSVTGRGMTNIEYADILKEKSLGMLVFASTLSGVTDGYKSAQAYKDSNGYSADEWEYFCADDLTTVTTKEVQKQYHMWIVEKGEENGKIMEMPLATTISYFLYDQYPSCSTK
jgi:hypothetical protein|tara:strand:+ start:862 stop:1242 length:381 start_codon:yes stop_codon:yes gene_type:complete